MNVIGFNLEIIRKIKVKAANDHSQDHDNQLKFNKSKTFHNLFLIISTARSVFT